MSARSTSQISSPRPGGCRSPGRAPRPARRRGLPGCRHGGSLLALFHQEDLVDLHRVTSTYTGSTSIGLRHAGAAGDAPAHGGTEHRRLGSGTRARRRGHTARRWRCRARRRPARRPCVAGPAGDAHRRPGGVAAKRTSASRRRRPGSAARTSAAMSVERRASEKRRHQDDVDVARRRRASRTIRVPMSTIGYSRDTHGPGRPRSISRTRSSKNERGCRASRCLARPRPRGRARRAPTRWRANDPAAWPAGAASRDRGCGTWPPTAPSRSRR